MKVILEESQVRKITLKTEYIFKEVRGVN